MIPIKNVYYMLSYFFQILNEQGYKSISTEEFANAADLCAAILARGISNQIRLGLNKDYIIRQEQLSAIRGKIELSESIKRQTMYRKQLVCSFDEFSVDSQMNRIVKTTAEKLISSQIAVSRKKELRKLMAYFRDVSTVDLHSLDWNIRYDRNNQTYRMLISICYLVVKGLLQTQETGSKKMMDFFDEKHMYKLYEKFILEYYRKEHKELKAEAMQIDWQLDDDRRDMLPIMQTDITLSNKDKSKVLIIDAKYHGQILKEHQSKYAIKSANLYQIFTYVKNQEEKMKAVPHEVAGMLLYAKTGEEMYPENEYQMSGNKISVRTLDLNQDFEKIKEQLDGIADSYFG